MKGKDIRMRYLGSKLREVTVLYYPRDVPRTYLRNTLGQDVVELTHRRWKWHTGNLRVTLQMEQPIPNFLRVGDWVVQVEYEGVRRFCRRSSAEGHIARSFTRSCGVF